MPVSPQARLDKPDIGLLGANFPPGLNTATPASDLGVDESPDAYGFDLSKDGVIAKGTISTCSSRTLKTTTLSTVPYYIAYQRLWNITNRTASTASTILTYGALNYDDIYVPQRNGKMYFDEDSNNILAIQPFGPDFMFVAKSSGGYVISNISDTRGFWSRSDIMTEIKCGAATGLIELDGVIYCSSSSGLFAYNRGEVVEITRKVRDDLTNFGSVALTVDYQKKYVRGGSSYIYEVPTQKLFRWDSSNFRYTSRQFHLPDWRPFSVSAVWLAVNQTNTDGAWFKYQIKIEDDSWSDEVQEFVNYAEEEFTAYKLNLDDVRSCKKWQIRLTDISSNLQIKDIRLESEDFSRGSYSE